MSDANRFAAVDVGSNTVKLLIADRLLNGSFQRVLELSSTTRLGEGIHLRRLREAAIRRTLDALAGFADEIKRLNVDAVAAVGTSALRDAVNQDDILVRARELGIPLEPISGEEEARLSFRAVAADSSIRGADNLLVIDIGGGSTEVIFGDARTANITSRVSLALGAVRLTEAVLHSDPPSVAQVTEARELAEQELQGLDPVGANYSAIGVGGTFVNLAAMDQGIATRIPDQLHGARLSLGRAEELLTRLAEQTVEQRRSIVGLDPARADIIVGGVIIFCQTLGRLGLEEVAVSCRGLRWGLLYDRFGGPTAP